MEKEYPLLSSPVEIGSIELPNRMVMAPVDTQYCTPEGYVTPRMIEFYRRRAAGGVSLIITENTGIDFRGKSNIRMHGLFDDSYMEGARKLVSAVKKAGSRIFIQLNHAGRQSTYLYLGGAQPVAPSPIPCPLIKVEPRELEPREIKKLIESFTDSAYRAWRIGADGVELHMAHGYLLCSFLSPFSNRRSDQYGGSFEGRLRFPLEVFKSIRGKLHSSFIVGCRISANEEVEGGLTLKESIPIAQSFEKAGMDYIHVSACNNASGHKNIPSYYEPPGVFSDYAAAIKKAVTIPVISVGRLHSLKIAEEVLAAQKADLVAAARPFIVDPDFAAAVVPVKPQTEQNDKTSGGNFAIPGTLAGQHCLSCNRCIAALVKGKEGLLCTVNPFLGKDEFESLIHPANIKKLILVVGGGPAGIITAFRAARRGHSVTLWERKARLGGALYYAGLAPHKEPFKDYLNFLIKCLNDLPVVVVMEQIGDLDAIKKFGPDEVIFALGASKPSPNIPGIESIKWKNVASGFDDADTTGTRILVVGGGARGVELSEFLALRGGDVTLVEARGQIAYDTPLQIRYYLMRRLFDAGVKVLLRTEVKEIAPGSVCVNETGRERDLIGFDRVILAFGEKPNAELYHALLKEKIGAQLIGDAAEPRDLLAAVREGTFAGDTV